MNFRWIHPARIRRICSELATKSGPDPEYLYAVRVHDHLTTEEVERAARELEDVIEIEVTYVFGGLAAFYALMIPFQRDLVRCHRRVTWVG